VLAPPDGATRVAAVIGDPVRHSLSPTLHNAAFAALGLAWVYVAFEVPGGAAARAVEGMRALGIEGLSVTMPHKAAVAEAVDRCSDVASRLGAVNCVRRSGGDLVGENTDGAGFLASLREDAAFDPAGQRCLVLGAGGAARAVVLALASAGAAEVAVVNRTPSRAADAASLAGRVGVVRDVDAADGAALIVNATPLGMAGTGADGANSPIDPARIGPGQIVADLVYHPLRTALLDVAQSRGAVQVNGLGMLLHQAALAFEHWTGHPAPIEAMRVAALARLGYDFEGSPSTNDDAAG
jgi:shikimate dehydrogenase